jgi:hypothetical protein
MSSCGLGYRKDALSILYSLLIGAIPFSSATDTVTFDSSAGAWQIGLGVDKQLIAGPVQLSAIQISKEYQTKFSSIPSNSDRVCLKMSKLF